MNRPERCRRETRRTRRCLASRATGAAAENLSGAICVCLERELLSSLGARRLDSKRAGQGRPQAARWT